MYRPYLRKLEANQQEVARTLNMTHGSGKNRGRGLRGLLFRLKLIGVATASILTGNACKKSQRTALISARD